MHAASQQASNNQDKKTMLVAARMMPTRNAKQGI
jgi:hypothetical protein